MDKTITLTQAITAHGTEVFELTLRAPTGKDVRELGYPYKLGGDESVTLDADRIARYVTRLANVPLSSVDQIVPYDMNNLAWAVTSFFLGSEPISAIKAN